MSETQIEINGKDINYWCTQVKKGFKFSRCTIASIVEVVTVLVVIQMTPTERIGVIHLSY